MPCADSKSGARFERVVIDGEPYVLKHVDHRDDWIMRQTGDVGCVPVRVWESGVFDLLPAVHRPRDRRRRPARATRGAVLMRDVGAWLVPPGDDPDRRRPAPAAPRPPRGPARRARGVGATPSAWCRSPTATRSSAPPALACEAALGFPQPVPAIAADGWRRLDDASPGARRRTRGRCATRPGRSSTRWPRPRARSCTATPSSPTSGTGPDGRTVLVDWAHDRRRAAARRGRALTSRSTAPASPPGYATRRDHRRVPRRARTPRHRHRAVVRAAARAVPRRRDAAARRGRRRSTRPARSSRGGATGPSTPRLTSSSAARADDASSQSNRSGCSRVILSGRAGRS